MSSNRERILIAIPSLEYSASTSLVHMCSLAQQMNYHPGKYTFDVTTVEGVPGHDLVRNDIAKLVLDKKIDRVWMIDDDITPERNIFDLLEVDADIVAPLMPTLKWSLTEDTFDFTVAYAAGVYRDIDDLKSNYDPELTGGVIDVDMVGTGCTLIRRKVLEDPAMRYPSSDLKDDDPPAIFKFQKKSNGSYKSGEDEDFCVRAKRLGYRIKLHTGIEVGHMKMVNVAHILKMKRFYQSAAQQNPVAYAIQ